MPKRSDISSILIIGAGPIVIGQACEFDYSGVQACKALRAEGYRIILVNSNPATIMTDPDVADATYIEPITPEMVEKIIAKERPDALLPTMGGQTALNTALALEASGALAKYNVEMIGARAEVIDKAEDRQKFRDAMDAIGLESPKSKAAHSMDEALEGLEFVGLPAIIRPSAGFTANCTFEPPVSTPISRRTARLASRMIWYSLSVSVSAGAMVTLSPVCTPIASRFSMEQMMMQLSAWSRTTSISNSFQPRTLSSIRTSLVIEADRPAETICSNSSRL